MNRQAEYDAIAADVMAALECARNGQSHGRLNQMMLRTIVKATSFKPPCPESVLPIERRRFSIDNPAPMLPELDKSEYGYFAKHEGRYGMQSQE